MKRRKSVSLSVCTRNPGVFIFFFNWSPYVLNSMGPTVIYTLMHMLHIGYAPLHSSFTPSDQCDVHSFQALNTHMLSSRAKVKAVYHFEVSACIPLTCMNKLVILYNYAYS